ncbi:transmembrane pair domain-containing protein [Alcanivorax xiamenensis]|uniref:Transmembrane pair domain-containing protein n=1 Tax=Alcanivorax xiamenensis TaxID=1177156 RepID=A0ABQ6YDW9_9GAMM|nr:PACE efflux transporter [Alcanivorax xiamenensis]KAF0808115.1 transmembrane pair domain-containing protein [Alcanivorax xiamenensis]
MALRTAQDRVRHAVLFEVIGLAIMIPVGAYLFQLPAAHMGVLGVAGATIATVWNFVFNLGFDHAMFRWLGHTRKTLRMRVGHALLFEGGLLVMLLPMVAWYLGIGLMQALMMDLAMVVFYLFYAFGFNWAYDRVFPVAPMAQPAI